MAFLEKGARGRCCATALGRCPPKLAMPQEVRHLFSNRLPVDHRRVSDRHDEMVGLAGEMRRRYADFAIIWPPEHEVGCKGSEWTVTGDDAERIIDPAEGVLHDNTPPRTQEFARMIENQGVNTQSIQQVRQFAAAIRRAKHDHTAEIGRAIPPDIRTQHKTAH